MRRRRVGTVRAPTTRPQIAPIRVASMLVLPLSYLEHGDAESSFLLARSIFIAVPGSLCFFLPFLFIERVGTSFWFACGIGCALLPLGYVAHRFLTRVLF
ncbi:MAG: hypothetical protein CL933_00435 [Deltaproteobacteria bacterium]|nr:hypothetical protein [Deltaproteobacteria bacterium]